jgi:putative membrane protein
VRKLDPAVAASLAERIRAVEAASSAEVVVEIRAHSGSYAHAEARFAALAAFVVLLVVLFSPWDIAPIWVPPIVLGGYIMGVLLARLSNFIRRSMTTRRDRDARVRTTAAATFVERGITNTSRETGLLIFLSVLERRMELIADRGILDAVSVLEWNQLLEKTRQRAADTETLLEVLRELEPLLTRYLPVRAEDRDELSNEVRFVKK